MYATIRRYTANKGTIRGSVKKIQDIFLPMLKSIPGFVSYNFIEGGEEDGRDVVVTTTFCQTREGCEESARRAAAFVKENLGDIGLRMSNTTTGELLAQSW
jgi:hypothetical protein